MVSTSTFGSVRIWLAHEGELDQLSDRRGTGVGSRLFGAAVETARNSGANRLEIEADPHAEGWYRDRGAERIGETPSGSIPDRMLPVLELRL